MIAFLITPVPVPVVPSARASLAKRATWALGVLAPRARHASDALALSWLEEAVAALSKPKRGRK